MTLSTPWATKFESRTMNIKAKIIDTVPGSPEWSQHRARGLNASELAVAMGISTKMKRDDLVRCKATGIPIEHSDFVEQRVFAKGHEYEAIARPWAEEIIGEDLYCGVFAAEVDGLPLPLSASLDGHTAFDDPTFEHKQLNAELAASLDVGIIPDEYHPQMEQGLMLLGATRCLFMASNGNKETMRWCWYYSNPELRAKIIPTWKQFWADVAAYAPPAASTPAPTGKAPEALPALLVQVTGMVTASNLPEFKAVALGAIASVNRDLQTDQDFADAEKSVKWCAEIETRIKATKEHAMSQTASIDALFRTLTEISDEAKRVRLDLDKLVKARKEAIKGEIVSGGVAAFAAHVRELNAAMQADYMPQVLTDFGGCIKSLRTVDSIRNAVNSELARAKIAASEIATRIHANVAAIKASGLVVHDAAALVLKQPDDLAAVLAQRAAAEKEKEEAQRARILAEEEARLRAKAHAEKLKSEADARNEAERKVREAAEAMELDRWQAEQASLARAEREAVQAPAEQAKEPSVITGHFVLASVEQVFDDYFKTGTGIATTTAPAFELTATPPAADVGARMTLGEINAALHPVSVNGDALAFFGFDPVERVKASKLYRAMDLPAIRKAIARHVLDGMTA